MINEQDDSVSVSFSSTPELAHWAHEQCGGRGSFMISLTWASLTQGDLIIANLDIQPGHPIKIK